MVDSFNYAESRDDADAMITEFGTAAKVRRMTKSGSAWEPVLTPADYDTLAARVEFTYKQIQTRNVQATDTRWLVAAGPLATSAIVPTVGDKLVVGGNVVGEVLRSDPVNPAGIAVLFDVHVRA